MTVQRKKSEGKEKEGGCLVLEKRVLLLKTKKEKEGACTQEKQQQRLHPMKNTGIIVS